MSDLQDRANFAVMEGRAARFSALVAKQDAYDTRGELSLVYDGCSYGQHWGRSPNGGRMPVTPISSSSIRRGELFIGVRGTGSTILAGWMP